MVELPEEVASYDYGLKTEAEAKEESKGTFFDKFTVYFSALL